MLAPTYVRPIDLRLGTVQPFAAFEWVEDGVLEWSSRRKRVEARLAELAACDVLALQEVEFEAGRPAEWAVPPGMVVACAPSAYDLTRIAKRNVRVLGKDVAVGNLVCSRSEPAWTKALATTCLVCGFGDGWAVANVHLDAGSEATRVSTLRRALEHARKMEGPRLKLVVAGDWNSELKPGSALAAAFDVEATAADVDRERQDVDLDTWRELMESARVERFELGRVNTGITRVGLEDGAMRAWGIDHLAYTRDTCEPTKRLATLDDDDPSSALESGLPNEKEPSDHVPIVATFRAVPRPTLTADEIATLQNELAALLKEEAADKAASQLPLPPKPTKEQKQASRKAKKEFKARYVDRRRRFATTLTPPQYEWFYANHGPPEEWISG